MDTNQVIITESQYRAYKEYQDTADGIVDNSVIQRLYTLEHNPELVCVEIYNTPTVKLLAKFHWMYSILDTLVQQERKIQMSTMFAIPHP